MLAVYNINKTYLALSEAKSWSEDYKEDFLEKQAREFNKYSRTRKPVILGWLERHNET